MIKNCGSCVFISYKNQQLGIGRCRKYADTVNLLNELKCFSIELPKTKTVNGQLDLFN